VKERRGREYWGEQVAEWRRSGLSKRAYSERHGLPYSSLCRWAGKLTPAPASEPLVELGQVGGGAEPRAAIELVVGERYVLRLRPSVRAEHLREVLSALEGVR
jgi:hypothetical protein